MPIRHDLVPGVPGICSSQIPLFKTGGSIMNRPVKKILASALALLLAFSFFACSQDPPAPEPDVPGEPQPAESALEGIFPLEVGTLLYYTGPVDGELVQMITSVTRQEDITTVFFKAVNEDLSGEMPANERLFYRLLTIAPREIVLDGMTILQEPLTPGHSWQTPYYYNHNRGSLKLAGIARVEIVRVDGDQIETALTVTDERWPGRTIRERTVFQRGQGIIQQESDIPLPEENYPYLFSLEKMDKADPSDPNWFLMGALPPPAPLGGSLLLYGSNSDATGVVASGNIAPSTGVLEQDLEIICAALEQNVFQGLSISVGKIKNGALTVELTDGDLPWESFINAGSAGSSIYLSILAESFLQKELSTNDWIASVRFSLNGDPNAEGDHYSMQQIYRRSDPVGAPFFS
jgi:hypothetical protein